MIRRFGTDFVRCGRRLPFGVIGGRMTLRPIVISEGKKCPLVKLKKNIKVINLGLGRFILGTVTFHRIFCKFKK